jgi:hypothetical protein
MELDDLKNIWDDQSNKEQQQNLTTKLIEQMTQKKYNSKINKIAYPEIIGSIICLIAIIFIGLNFFKLDTIFLKAVGIVSILVLLTLSTVSLLSVRQLKISKDFNNPYAETLKIFATQKIEFYKLQKINMTLSYLLLVTIIILLSKFFSGKDITNSKYFWTFSFSLGYIFLLFLSRFVEKFYKSTLTKTEELLQELQP